MNTKIKYIQNKVLYTLLIISITIIPFIIYISTSDMPNDPMGTYVVIKSNTPGTSYFSFSAFDTIKSKGEYSIYNKDHILSQGIYSKTSPHMAKNIYVLHDMKHDKIYYLIFKKNKVYILGFNNEEYELEKVDDGYSLPRINSD